AAAADTAAARAEAAAKSLDEEERAAAEQCRVKRNAIMDMARRQKMAEAGRAQLVRDTQIASEAASEASHAAMFFEQAARLKRAKEKAALERARRALWDAKHASTHARQLAEVERSRQSAFGGGGAVMATAAAA
ncbi:unnamed protein product, partial [Scytosiphon promiscuus]